MIETPGKELSLLSKKNRFNWGRDTSSNEIHRIEWPWDESDDEQNEDDESYGAEDYFSSRPWGENNDGW